LLRKIFIEISSEKYFISGEEEEEEEEAVFAGTKTESCQWKTAL